MKSLLTRTIDVGRGSIGYLGVGTAPAHRVWFLRSGGREIALLASLRQPHRRSFKEGRKLQFEYRTWPEDNLNASEAALLERFITRLLRGEDHLAAEIAAPNAPSPLDGATNVTSRDGMDTLVLPITAGTGFPLASVVVRIASRGTFPLDVLNWSAQVECDLPELPAAALVQIQTAFLSIIACHLLGLPIPGIGQPEEKHNNPTRFAYFDLKRPDFNRRTLDHLRVQPGDNLVVSIEVPSSCHNRCIFCAPSHGEGPERQALSTSQAMEEIDGILAGLHPQLTAAHRTDVVFAGRDAFNSDFFLPVLRRIRSQSEVTRVTVVSPGTRLEDEAYVHQLAASTLSGVTLTLLGPDAAVHDHIAGRPGALASLEQGIDNLAAAGISWELNTVVVKDNLPHFPETLKTAGRLGSKVRVYTYVSEPFVPLEQAQACAPRFGDFAALLVQHKELVEQHVAAIHYVPYCLLPDWAKPLSGHSSQSFPAPPDELPEACKSCSAHPDHCGSVSSHYLQLFGDAELLSLSDADTQ